MTRPEIEREIIGACILCNGYRQVGNVLRTKNFQSPELARLWTIMTNMWGNEPINIRTVGNKYKSIGGKLTFISETTQYVVSAENVVIDAFTLLEYDIRERSIQIIDKAILDTETHNIDRISVLKTTGELLTNQSRDILADLEKVEMYLQAYKIPEAALFKELTEQVGERARSIRKQHLFNHLEQQYLKLKEELTETQTAA